MDNFSVVGWAANFLESAPTSNPEVALLASSLRAGSIKNYLNYEITTKCDDPDFPLVYLASSLLKKYPFPGFQKEARAKATERFFLAEQSCKETNVRLRNMMSVPNESNGKSITLLERARRNVASVLGEVPYESILNAARFTDGTDSANPYGFTSSYHKYAAKPQVTLDARSIGAIFINSNPRWAAKVAGALNGSNENYSFRPTSVIPSSLHTLNGNRVSFVPKNAKTDRAIAVEPHLNVFMQRAVGVVIRNYLKRKGVDLRHGQETNRDLALYGSARDSVATIDLSMASDTLSRVLVEWLLPPHWFFLLDTLRSKYGRIGSSTIEYEKFSSMGNGFTFELESLIFWALVKAVIPDEEWNRSEMLVAVYGDDLIVPTQYAEALIEILAVAGFTTNSEKTFLSGQFRESCGKDYLDGKNIRPIYVKDDISSSNKRTLYKLANSIRIYSGDRSDRLDIRNWLKSQWDTVRGLIRTPHLISADYGPDQGLMVSREEYELFGGASRDVHGAWEMRFLTPIPDVRALESLYRKKGREGQHVRHDYHLTLMVAFDKMSLNTDPLSYLDPQAPSDLLLNFSKGNPVRYITSRQRVGFFSDPPAW